MSSPRAFIGRILLWFIWAADEPKRRAETVARLSEDARTAAAKDEFSRLCEEVLGVKPEDLP